MTPEQQDRLIEVYFYLLITRLYKYNSDLDLLLDYIDMVARFQSFDTAIIKDAATKILSNKMYAPPKNEIAILLWVTGIPFRRIAKHAKMNHKRIYDSIRDFKANPYPIQTTFTPEYRVEFEKFTQVLQELCEVGGI